MKRMLFAAAFLALAVPASAQTLRGSTRPMSERIGVLAFGTYDSLNIASPKTFDAVFGASRLNAFGAGIDVVNVWRHLFVRVAASSARRDGERVAIVADDVFKLGTKLSMTMTPTELGAGWRFEQRNPRFHFTPYAGVQAVLMSYKETSTFADADENANETLKGFGAFGGIDIALTPRIIVGGEAQYRAIDSKPSATSASGIYGESNLGGAVLRLRAAFRF